MGGGIFSMGLIGPLILLFLGHVAIGLLFSGVAIAVRIKADSSLVTRKSQTKIDWAIAILAISELLQILGLRHLFGETDLVWLLVVGLFLLWPASAVLAIWGRGAGRKVLLVGHGLIALWVSAFFVIVIAHG
jgi:hypothetical protein